MLAIHGLGQNFRQARLPRAARAGKQIRVRETILGQRAPDRNGNMCLPDDFIKCLRPPFAIQSKISHDVPLSL